MGIVPKHEGILGSNLTGTDGDNNRTYTLTNSDAIVEQMQIIIAGAILQNTIDFTLDVSTGILTFINKVWDDQNISLDYFINDTTSTAVYDSGSYTISGADLTGTDGASNRMFVFVTSRTIYSEQMQVVVDNQALQIGIDFIIDTENKTITFKNAIFDASNISINYLYTKETYCASTLQVARFSGLGVDIQLEELGTGDNSTRGFDSEFGNIIADSTTLYFGSGTDNALGILILNTDYLLSLDDGRIQLTATGLSKLGTDNLYLSYTYSPKHSNTVLVSYLVSAAAEVEKLTNNYWGQEKSNTQYFDGYTSGYPQTDEPFGTQRQQEPEFELQYKSIQSVTAVEFLDYQGNVNGSVDSNYIRFDEDGRVLIGSYTVPNGKRNVKISFTHGYNEIPAQIQELCALVVGLKAFVNISGGSYKDVSTYTLGRKTFSIGQVYVNIRESIDQMKSRIESILLDVGYRYAIA